MSTSRLGGGSGAGRAPLDEVSVNQSSLSFNDSQSQSSSGYYQSNYWKAKYGRA